jgi:hypothetical protein
VEPLHLIAPATNECIDFKINFCFGLISLLQHKVVVGGSTVCLCRLFHTQRYSAGQYSALASNWPFGLVVFRNYFSLDLNTIFFNWDLNFLDSIITNTYTDISHEIPHRLNISSVFLAFPAALDNLMCLQKKF